MRTVCLLVLTVALFCAPVTAQQARDAARDKPRESGLVESAGVEFVLIDVDARDKEGNPLRGLTRDDFQIVLNGRDIPIETVDNLCACGFPVNFKQRRRTNDPTFAKHFVLYFDFSQMDELGREQALREAKRWLRNLPQQSTRVMIAAFSTRTGLETMTQFVEPHAATGALSELARAKRQQENKWHCRRHV